jgi:hypothetical protein
MIVQINQLHKRCSKTKVSDVKLKKDEAHVNMVLTIEMRSHTQRLVLQWEKELRKTNTAKDWEKEK